jgi:hypothetical protein
MSADRAPRRSVSTFCAEVPPGSVRPQRVIGVTASLGVADVQALLGAPAVAQVSWLSR